MPRKAKVTEPEVKVTEAETTPVEVEATPVETKPEVELARGERSKAIKKALKANKDKSPKEIAEIVTASGITTLAWQVSNVKSILSSKKKAKATPAAAPATETVAAAPAVAKDAVSIGLLQKAKKLAAQLGGIKEAKAAMDALVQILD
ncbi:MAG: hypothetical protein NTY19_16950 [Planctomycetota bacterium]|nr:hypothetical protein [Planctomycetota bacterium]